MDLEIIILNEVARQRKQYHITYLCGKKNYKWTSLQNKNKHTAIENKFMITKGERRGKTILGGWG